MGSQGHLISCFKGNCPHGLRGEEAILVSGLKTRQVWRNFLFVPSKSVRGGLPHLLLPMSPGSGNLIEKFLITLEKAGESSGVELLQWRKNNERKNVLQVSQ